MPVKKDPQDGGTNSLNSVETREDRMISVRSKLKKAAELDLARNQFPQLCGNPEACQSMQLVHDLICIGDKTAIPGVD